MAKVSDADIDVAILDVNLGGTKVYPFADALRALDIPGASVMDVRRVTLTLLP
mgnify:CR=1 FL=1